MKKLIAITLTLLLILTLIVPASAATTMHWDWGKARSSIDKAISQIVQEQQTEPAETTEPVATEYIVAEDPENVYVESDPEPVVEPVHEKLQSWRDWLRGFMNRLYYGEG